ncbi:DNA modification methylase [Tannerella sp. oral taxon BU063 isolate Cell 5]|uniref:site-specific DNA-methyltransferase (adenine-specific) n=1 Tax=Tannerella sp. oral taxon BU063 isolate Cell 5 TaxID=1410950 RepID=W2CAL6_9BACT|nr:DNA modification methylase [Tannerella sp. oral taxon BU063 isolate Cell 5]
MHTDTLRSFLEKDYPGIDKFLEQVIYRIFDKTELDPINKDDLADEENNIKLAHDTGIGRMELIGKIFVSGAWLRIYDVTVDSSVRMAHNRVNLQRLTRRIMHHNSAAFMVFHYDEAHATGREWRFSFCYKSSESEQTTDPKRFTFLFGRGHSSRTAAENFQKLFDKKGQEVTIADIREAFSVEALSKEFFDKYREHYARFVLHATGKRYVKQANKWEERTEHAPDEAIMQAFGGDEKRVRDYVKKLLGRIVFLHFLQKKGWMGVPDDGHWGEGKFRFMYKLFEEATAEQQADFVHEVLEHLFFHALNTDRKADNDLYDTRVFDEKVRVPYLNGGLFEEDDADRCFKACTDARFPTDLFRELFAFFEQYNFTIDENDPDDAQVGVDPEMLGRIFESLLEDNKEKGAFYTPKEIVQYMCRRSLTAYLQTDVPKEKEKMRQAIDCFVRTKDYNELRLKLPPSLREQVAERLRTVKICDPAIGSGAFPMGLLRELYLCRIALEDGVRENRAKSHAEIKKEILQQNIYGVDLDRGAVDIARLRFWLSLVVDEDVPQPLPNLDYKIMQGNSLLERYKDVDLSTLASQKTDGRLVFIDDESDASRLSLHHLLVAYYGEDNHDKKQSLRARIQQNIEEQLKAQRYEVDLSDVDLFANAHFFLWHTWFSEVFSRPTKEGFDIVIGNPPYISTKGVDKDDKKMYELEYGFSDDTYNLFTHRGLRLLAPNGCLCLITPKTFWTIQTKRNMRDLILSYQLDYIFDTANPFESAMVDTCVFQVIKRKMEPGHKVEFLDGSSSLSEPTALPPIEQSVYLETQSSVIFKPTEFNLAVYRRLGSTVKKLYDEWWDKISTSKKIAQYADELAAYRASLKPGDIALLGCLTEGGQGLATANNGKYVAVRANTKWADNIRKSRPKKLEAVITRYRIPIERLDGLSADDFLATKSEAEIAALFDSLKEDYGRDIFGQGYLFKIVEEAEIADVDTLTDDEKENGIASDKPYYVPYDKGDKDGNRWYLETPFVIAWSKENVHKL